MISLSRFRDYKQEKRGPPPSSSNWPTALDNTGRVLTGQDFVNYTRTMGLCERCGETRTHLRVRVISGLCSPKLKPITSKSERGSGGTYSVYKGYCLGPRCFSLSEVQRLLKEPIISQVSKTIATTLPMKKKKSNKKNLRDDGTSKSPVSAKEKGKNVREVITGSNLPLVLQDTAMPQSPRDLSLVVTKSGRPLFDENTKALLKASTTGSGSPGGARKRNKRDKKAASKWKTTKKNAASNVVATADETPHLPVDVDLVTEIMQEPSLRGKHVTIHMDEEKEETAQESSEMVVVQDNKATQVQDKESREERGQIATCDEPSKDHDTLGQVHRASPSATIPPPPPPPPPPISEDAIMEFEDKMPSRSRSSFVATKTQPLARCLSEPVTRHSLARDDPTRTPKLVESDMKDAATPTLSVVVTPCTESSSSVSDMEVNEQLITGFEMELSIPDSFSVADDIIEEQSIDSNSSDDKEDLATPPSPSSDSNQQSEKPLLSDSDHAVSISKALAAAVPERKLESIMSMATVPTGNVSPLREKTSGKKEQSSPARCSGVNIPPKHPLRSVHSKSLNNLAVSSSSSSSHSSHKVGQDIRRVGLDSMDASEASEISSVTGDQDSPAVGGSKSKSFKSYMNKVNRKKGSSVSLSPSLARTQHYPENDASLRHALNAGVLWQTLLGQHVRFPETWFDGARAPPMGVDSVMDHHKGDLVPQHRWIYIARDVFTDEPILDEFVKDEYAPGRLLLHIVIRSEEDGRPVQDVAIGCYHPKSSTKKRTVWMAIRKRSGHTRDTTARIDPMLTSECRVQDIMMASPFGKNKGHRLHNKALETLFGDEPPVQTVFIQEWELVAKVRAFRDKDYIPDFKPITLVLINIFLESRAEL